MDFKKYLQNCANDLDQEIEQILTNFLHQVEKINLKLVPFALGLISSCKGGKRIRGTLCKLGYEIASGVILSETKDLSRMRDSDKLRDSSSFDKLRTQNDILRIGAAYEILHAAILIHDDIIDQSELRRGKLTLYRSLGGNHYGISQALMLGDIGLFLPIKLIADAFFLGEYKQSLISGEIKNKALSFFAQTVINTGWGEVLDVEIPHLRGQEEPFDYAQGETDVIAIHKLKTAQYTISGPLILGAILAGGDEELLGMLGKLGENLGIAFQIQDDILGVFGEEQSLGKSVTSDIEEGKNTLFITQALKNADKKQKEILEKYYGKGKIGMEELEKIREVFTKTGALDYSREKAVEYVLEAKKVIPQITDDPNMRKLLQEMADYLVERRK